MAVLAGCDFFTVEVLTWRGLVTYYVLFFLHLESRRVSVARITRHPNPEVFRRLAAIGQSNEKRPRISSLGAFLIGQAGAHLQTVVLLFTGWPGGLLRHLGRW
jgi:hypothetical protein